MEIFAVQIKIQNAEKIFYIRYSYEAEKQQNQTTMLYVQQFSEIREQ